jgi:hypothetical protein
MRLERTVAGILLINLCAISANGGAFKPPKQTYALRFSDRRIAVAPLKTALNLGGSYTLEAWIIPEAQLRGAILGRWCDPAYGDPWNCYGLELVEGKNLRFSRSTGKPGSWRSISAPFNRPLNVWTHVAATLEKNRMRLFINAVEVANGQCSGPTANTSVPFALGNGATAEGGQIIWGFLGGIAQARVWKRALTTAELQAQAVKYLTGREPGLAAYWPLDDGPGLKIRDLGPFKVNIILPSKAVAWTWQDPLWARTAILNSGPHYLVQRFLGPSYLSDGRLFDFDGDNHPDFVGVGFFWDPYAPSRLMAFRNDGTGRYTNVTSQVLVQHHKTWHPRDFALADFNGDGLTDMFIADHGPETAHPPGAQNLILIQKPPGIVSDETSFRLPPHSDFSHSCAVGDIDGDGDIDIYVGNINEGDSGPYFLINNGAGVFNEDQTRIPAVITDRQIKYTSSFLLDFDKDGDNDLVLGRMDIGERDEILLNDGTGHFIYAPANTLPPRFKGSDWGTIDISSADFDGDSWPDLLMATVKGIQKCGIQLLLNNRDGTYRDATAQVPYSQPETNCWIIWLVPADVDGDGWTDFLMIGAGQEIRLFLNRGKARFIDGTDLLPMTIWEQFNYVAFNDVLPADVDGDGDMDLFMCKGGAEFFVAKNLQKEKAAEARRR